MCKCRRNMQLIEAESKPKEGQEPPHFDKPYARSSWVQVWLVSQTHCATEPVKHQRLSDADCGIYCCMDAALLAAPQQTHNVATSWEQHLQVAMVAGQCS